MNKKITLVAGDERPKINLALSDNVTGVALDLSDATTTVKVRFRAQGTTTTLFEATCTKIGDGSLGQVYFEFPAGGLDVAIGEYRAQVAIHYNTDVQTVKEILKFKVIEEFAEAS